MPATGGVETSWRKSTRRRCGSKVRREIQFLTAPLAVAQMWMRSARSSRSRCSTCTLGPKYCGHLVTSATIPYTTSAGAATATLWRVWCFVPVTDTG